MKEGIHPKYAEIAGHLQLRQHSSRPRSTVGKPLHVEVCSVCHPFYTGKQKVDGHRGPHRQVPPALRPAEGARGQARRVRQDRLTGADAVAHEKAASAAFFVCGSTDHRAAMHARPAPATSPEAVDPEAVAPSAPFRALKQLGLVAAVRRVGRARARRPRPVEDRGRDHVRRRRAKWSQRGDCRRAAPRRRAVRCRSPPLAYMLAARWRSTLFSPPLALHNAARAGRRRRCSRSCCVAPALREPRAQRPRVPLDAGADPRRQRRLLGSRARLSPELGLDARRRGRRSTGLALALRRPRRGRRRARRRASRIAFLADGFDRAALARRDRAAAARCADRQWRNRALRVTLRSRRSSRAVALRCRGRSRSHARDPELFAQWLGGESPGALRRAARRRPRRSARTTCARTSPGSPGRRCRSSLWTAVDARPRLQRRPARAGRRRSRACWRS